MASKKCQTPVRPQEQFKSKGKRIVDCPCGDEECPVQITEQLAYRHLTQGLGGSLLPKSSRVTDSTDYAMMFKKAGIRFK